MKCRERKAVSPVEILANDHFTAIPYDCSELTGLASDGVIKAGTIVPSNDANAIGYYYMTLRLTKTLTPPQ